MKSAIETLKEVLKVQKRLRRLSKYRNYSYLKWDAEKRAKKITEHEQAIKILESNG
jgi:hypothetical protein